VDPGFDPEGLATVQIVLPTEGYEGREDILAVYDDLVAGIREIPGVTQVSAATKLPFPGLSDVVIFENPGGTEGDGGLISAQQVFVLPGYHETMGIPLLDGEDLEGIRVGAAPRGMLITENMARRYWPQDSPLGVNLDGEVVRGIVRDVKRNSLRVEADPVVYMSLLDMPSRQINIIARTRGDATTLAGRMREAIQNYDEGIPIRRVVSMPDLIADSAAPERYRAFLMGVFAALATLLAGVGVFGVSARGVARRRKELAVRICLGAEEQKLMGRVVKDGLLTGAPATLVGLIAAAWTGHLLSSLLFGVEPADPLTLGAVASFLSLVIMTASYLPARTIARSDPARALRAEE